MDAELLLWAVSIDPSGRPESDTWHAFDLPGYNDGLDALSKCGESMARVGQAVSADGAHPGELCRPCQSAVNAFWDSASKRLIANRLDH
jgi:hypothetical protein